MINMNKLKYEINQYCNMNDSSDVSDVLYNMAYSLLNTAIKKDAIDLFICEYPFLIGILEDIQFERSKIIKMNSQVVWYMDLKVITLDDINAILDSNDQECMIIIDPKRFNEILDKDTAGRMCIMLQNWSEMLSECKDKEWYFDVTHTAKK